VRAEVRRKDRRGSSPSGFAGEAQAPSRRSDVPPPTDRRFEIERSVLKLALQHAAVTAAAFAEVEVSDFTHPVYREIFSALEALGGLGDVPPEQLSSKVQDDLTRSTLSGMYVEPLAIAGDLTSQVAEAYVVRLRELTALRRIEQLKSKLQRMNPVNEPAEYNRMFGELVALESHRRSLRERVIGNAL
jgi:DNA primase